MHRLARQSLLLLDADEDVSKFVDEDSDKTFNLLPRHMIQYDCLKEVFNQMRLKKKQKKTPADKFLDLIFRNNFFIFNFSKMCSR